MRGLLKRLSVGDLGPLRSQVFAQAFRIDPLPSGASCVSVWMNCHRSAVMQLYGGSIKSC